MDEVIQQISLLTDTTEMDMITDTVNQQSWQNQNNSFTNKSVTKSA